MDGIQDISNILLRVSENPEALNALSGLLGSLSSRPQQSLKQERAEISQNTQTANVMNALGALISKSGANGGREESGGEGRASGGGIFGSKEEIKNRILLLNAIRPYLSEQRRERLETVIKLLKLTELGELGSILGKL